MFRPRVIPVLLLKGKGLVKTVQFKNERYIGDPINAVKLFNDHESDELVFLDISASKEGRVISAELAEQICDEAFMPFAVGGGIKNPRQAALLLKAGAEKIVINSSAAEDPSFIRECALEFGSQSIVVSVDVKKSLFGNYSVMTHAGSRKNSLSLEDYLKIIEENGAGEIIINSIDKDGMMSGYDIDLIKKVTSTVKIPVIACGGCGSLQHLGDAYYEGGAHALAAGSIFVYHGDRKAVLINYPADAELKKIFNNGAADE